MAYRAASHQGAVKVPSLELSFGLKKERILSANILLLHVLL